MKINKLDLVILVGGRGKRIFKFTKTIPKPLKMHTKIEPTSKKIAKNRVQAAFGIHLKLKAISEAIFE